MSALLINDLAQQRIQELEAERAVLVDVLVKRNQELQRHVDLLNAENDTLRDDNRELRAELASLRVKMLDRGDD